MIRQKQQPIKDLTKQKQKQKLKNVQNQVKDKSENENYGRQIWTQNSSSIRYDAIDPKPIYEIVDEIENRYLERNTFIFGILMFIVHAAICIVYGFKIQTPSLSAGNRNIIYLQQLNQQQIKLGIQQITTTDITPILLNIFTIFVIIVGFGLLFSYNKKLVWSGMGFQLFICCFTVQFYFIVNNLITRIGFNSNLSQYSQHWNIHLWNYQFFHMDQITTPVRPEDYIKVYGNTLLDALKCGLANCIAFSAIRGRAGLLQAFILVLFGTIGFQLSRQILESLGIDFGHSNSIFTFGGFYGFSIAMIKYMRSKITEAEPSSQHKFYQANLNSSSFSLIGLGILIAFFPILASHPTFKQYLYFSQSFLLAPYSIYHSMSAGALMSLAFSFLFYGKANIRSFINGIVASGIAVLCSSYFIFNPGYPMVIGLVSALLQVTIQGIIEKKFIKRFDIISTYSFSLFGVQGLIGAVAGSIFKAIMQASEKQLNYYRGDGMKNATTPIILGVISAGIGIGIGIFVGFLINFFDYHRTIDCFHDQTYWNEEQKVFHQQEDQFQNWLELWQKVIPNPIPKP